MQQLRLEDALGTMRVDLCGCVPAMHVDGRRLIAGLKADGYGPTAIARHLNAIGASTPSGRGRWWPETVIRHADPGYPLRNAAYMRSYRARRRMVS